jgi:hypothetical protein
MSIDHSIHPVRGTELTKLAPLGGISYASETDAVRVYNHSPDHVGVQVRVMSNHCSRSPAKGRTQIAHATLNSREVAELIATLQAALQGAL